MFFLRGKKPIGDFKRSRRPTQARQIKPGVKIRSADRPGTVLAQTLSSSQAAVSFAQRKVILTGE
jgi:hypothetical protein